MDLLGLHVVGVAQDVGYSEVVNDRLGVPDASALATAGPSTTTVGKLSRNTARGLRFFSIHSLGGRWFSCRASRLVALVARWRASGTQNARCSQGALKRRAH
jgi:hypothetical protein